jgi:arabinogalactan oligomer/maltooligosaccharide transport system substrate-binding protein
MNTKYMRICALIVLFTLLLSALAACAPAAETEEPAAETEADVVVAEAPAEPVTLEIWINDRVSQPGMDAMTAVIEAWAAETGNTVNITEGAFFEMMGNATTAIPAGSGPDLILLTNNYLGPNLAGGLILPMDGALTEEELAKYTPGAIDAFTLDGSLMGIPVAADINALVYNRALVSEPPATMDELITLAQGMTSGDTYGFLYPIDAFWYSWPFVAADGGYVFNFTDGAYDTSDVGLANEGAIEGLNFVRDMVSVDNLMPFDVTWDVMNALFSAGQVGMTITNPTNIPTFRDAGIDVGIAVIPPMSNGEYPRPFATYTGFAVSAYSAHPTEAGALAVYLGQNLGGSLYAANPGNIPVYADALNDPAVTGDPDLAIWMEQLTHSDMLPSINEMNYVWVPAGNAFTAVVHGDATAEEALPSAVEQILQGIAESGS